jgi:hypothetical protein
MKVTLKYDQGIKKEEVVTLEVCEKDLERMMENDYQQRLACASSEEVVLKRNPEELIKEMNRQEYNAWRRHHRYIDARSTTFEKDNEGSEIDMMDTLADHSWERERQKQEEYEEICQQIRQILKPKQANMIIAICIEGMPVIDYALKIDDTPKRVYDRFYYTQKVLKESLTRKFN